MSKRMRDIDRQSVAIGYRDFINKTEVVAKNKEKKKKKMINLILWYSSPECVGI